MGAISDHTASAHSGPPFHEEERKKLLGDGAPQSPGWTGISAAGGPPALPPPRNTSRFTVR